MRYASRKGLWAGVLTAVLVVSGLSVTAVPANAAGANKLTASGSSAASTSASAVGNRLVVRQSPEGTITIEQGAVLQAGQVIKAEFYTSFAAGDLEILQLHNNATLEEVDTKLDEAGQGGAVAEAAMRWFTGTWDMQPNVPAKTTLYGGRPFVGANKFDVVLAPGKYIVTQLRPSGNVKPSTVEQIVTVVGTPGAQLPVVDGKISVVNTNGPDVFSAYSTTKGANKLKNGPVTLINKTGSITNRTRELHFFDFTKVPQGTTPAQACDLVTAQGPGNAASFGTMSTQRVVNGYLNVPLGLYWITSWIPDVNSGTPHAIECDGVLVEVVA